MGLALGDGRVVHAWDTVRVDDGLAIPALDPAPGWDPPRLLGWATPEDVLAGSTPRDWDAA